MSGHYVQSSTVLYVPAVTAYAVGQSCWQAVSRGKSSTDITCIDTEFNREIKKRFKLLKEFKPPRWASGPLLQLYCAIACPTPKIDYKPEVLRLQDGGSVVLDWSQRPSDAPGAPIAIILPGIAGHSQERYVRRMVAQLMSQGWVAVVYNRRGHRKEEVPSQKSKSMKSVSLDFIAIERQHSGSAKSRSRSRSPEIKASSKGILPEKRKESRLLLAHMQHNDDGSKKRKVWPMYCDMEDMHEVVLHVKSTAAGDSRVFAVGFSAGSGSVTKYVSEKAGECVLNGAVSVANGYSVRTGMAWVHKKTWMLERMLVQNLKELYKRCKPDIKKYGKAKVSEQDVFSCKTMRDIDTVLTAKLYGFDDVDEYWEKQSSWKSMPYISVPILCLNSRDDPLINPCSTELATSWANTNENIISVTTSHGGHLGWVTGWRKQWMCPAVSEYLLALDSALDGSVSSHTVQGS